MILLSIFQCNRVNRKSAIETIFFVKELAVDERVHVNDVADELRKHIHMRATLVSETYHQNASKSVNRT